MREGFIRKLMNQRTATIIAAITLLVLLATFTASSTKVVASRIHGFNPAKMMDIAILNYHKVDDMPIALSISPQDFERQMAYLYENGYRTIDPDELLAYLKFGKPLPAKPIMITFDDGYRDNYTYAFPILQKYGFTATFFVVAGHIGEDSRFMTWEEVRHLSKSGHTIGSHTLTHVDLTRLSPEQALAELTASKAIIEKHIDKPVRYLAYPGGAVNKTVTQLARTAGYKAAFSIRFGKVGMESDYYALERIPIFRSHQTFRSFFWRVNAASLMERFGLVRQ